MQTEEETTEGNSQMDIKNDVSGRVYEVGYHLVPTLEEGNVPTIHGDLKDLITSTFKGEIISEDVPKMMDLAYTMLKVVSNVRSKFDTAYFGWIKFAMEADQVLELKKKLDLDPKIIRFLILKTVKENTIATKRFVQRGVGKRALNIKTPDEVAAPINEKEVDKEIDALIQ